MLNGVARMSGTAAHATPDAVRTLPSAPERLGGPSPWIRSRTLIGQQCHRCFMRSGFTDFRCDNRCWSKQERPVGEKPIGRSCFVVLNHHSRHEISTFREVRRCRSGSIMEVWTCAVQNLLTQRKASLPSERSKWATIQESCLVYLSTRFMRGDVWLN